MLLVISPAKTQDINCRACSRYTMPTLLGESRLLIEILKGFTEKQLGELMGISDALARLNCQRFRAFHTPFDLQNAGQALLVFKGDVYGGMNTDNYEDEDFDFAQTHLRILSGLYGVLRPLDLIQPYRLEMGTRLASERGKDLYAFWGARITEALNAALPDNGQPELINLASSEYFKAVRPKEIRGRVVTVTFKERKNGDYRVIGLTAKRARGLMADFVIKNRLTTSDELQGFDREGYRFRADLSAETELVFCRE
ncbi:MAG: peroxide stress protein YaaA [Thermodesulfobacteriota bacterium]